MSQRVQDLVMIHPELDGAERLIMIEFARRCDEYGRGIWTFLDRIALIVRRSRRTCQRILNRLIAGDWITRQINRGGGAFVAPDRRPNLYTINLARLQYGPDWRRRLEGDVYEPGPEPALEGRSEGQRGDKTVRGVSPSSPPNNPYSPPTPPRSPLAAARAGIAAARAAVRGRRPATTGRRQHPSHDNALAWAKRLVKDRKLPVRADEVLSWCYVHGAGDPWAGTAAVAAITLEQLDTARDPLAALRARFAAADPR